MRQVGIFGLAALAYFVVCAGPFGIEPAIKAGGALPFFIAIGVTTVMWALPQALMTAELSAMFHENAGFIRWVERAMGPMPAYFCAFNSALSNLLDLPLYPILFASYASSCYQALAGTAMPLGWVIACKFACLLFITAMNLRGIGEVGTSNVLIGALVLLPFVIEAGVAAPDIQPSGWVSVSPNINWGLLMSTLLWNVQGFDMVACFAGEVSNPGRTYPIGISVAVLLIVATYVVPVLVGVGIQPDTSKWNEGYLTTVAGMVAPWLGVWVTIAASAAQLGNGLAMQTSSARVLWTMGTRRMVPPIFSCIWERFNSPAVAVLTQGVSTAVIMLVFDFDSLIVVDTLFNNASLVLEALAFLRLRYLEPTTHRPYVVPGGLPFAWVVTLSKLLVVGFAMGTAGYMAWAVCASANLLFLLGWFLRRRFFVSAEADQTIVGGIVGAGVETPVGSDAEDEADARDERAGRALSLVAEEVAPLPARCAPPGALLAPAAALGVPSASSPLLLNERSPRSTGSVAGSSSSSSRSTRSSRSNRSGKASLLGTELV